jgi:lipoprotein signal peptidase
MAEPNIQATATGEQILYANILEKGMYVGLLLLFITFALYVFGIMTPVIPLDQVANYWTTSAHDYLVAINNEFLHWDHLPLGWAWFSLLSKGDFLNFLPIAILSGVTIMCYLAIVPGLFRRGDTAYAVMAIAEAVILAAAASGLLAVGH